MKSYRTIAVYDDVTEFHNASEFVMRFVLLILLIICGTDFGAENETQGSDRVRCRLLRFHSRFRCPSRSLTPTPVTCVPHTRIVMPVVQTTTNTADEADEKETTDAAFTRRLIAP